MWGRGQWEVGGWPEAVVDVDSAADSGSLVTVVSVGHVLGNHCEPCALGEGRDLGEVGEPCALGEGRDLGEVGEPCALGERRGPGKAGEPCALGEGVRVVPAERSLL